MNAVEHIMEDMIEMSNHFVECRDIGTHSPTMRAELCKVEQTIRKAYIQSRWICKYLDGDLDEAEYLANLNGALIRDGKYIKARDNLGAYDITA